MPAFKRYAPWLVLPVWLFILLYWRGSYWMGHWYVKWTLVLWAGTALASFYAWRAWFKRDRWAASCFAPLGLSVLWSLMQYAVWARSKVQLRGEWPHHLFWDWTTSNIHGWSTLAYSGTLFLLLSLVLILCLPYRYRSLVHAILALTWAFAVAGVFLSWNKGMSAFTSGSFSGNASMHGCLIACTYMYALGALLYLPVGWKLTPYFIGLGALAAWTGTLIALLHLDQTVPLAVFGVVTAVGWFKIAQRNILRFGVPIALAVLLLGLGYYYQGMGFFSTTGRDTAAVTFMSWWSENANPWLGTGSGSMVVIGPKIMKGWMWLHNDWLQTLFELGWLGLAGAVASAALIVRRARSRPSELAALAGWGATMAMNYPLRLPIHASCLVLVVWLAVTRESRDPETP